MNDRVFAAGRTSRAGAGIMLALTFLFLQLCWRPLWHTDVWGHLSYGRHIWEKGSLPATEPLLPYSHGVPFVDTAWLSQLVGYAVVSTERLQLAGLQGLFAFSVTACAAMLSLWTFRQTTRLAFALLAVGIFVIPAWNCVLILRPQLAGLVCFVFVLTRLARTQIRSSDLYVVPCVFILWANSHPSFPIGLGLMVCFCLGRAWDSSLRTGSFRILARDRRLLRLLTLTIFSTAAVFINPYGFRQLAEILHVSANPNLQDLTEWQPLSIRNSEGLAFAATVIGLCFVFRSSPRRIRSWEFLALVGFGLAAMWSVRMLVWWVPVCSLLIPLHAFATWRKWRRWPLVPQLAPCSFQWSLVCLAILAGGFLASPVGQAVILNHHRERAQSVSSFTPMFAARYLSEHPPQGMVLAIYEWSDYLLWAGPTDLQLLLNSHAHLIPRDVWMAYMQVIEQRSGWKEALDRYGVNTIVVDRSNRTTLIAALDADPGWKRLTEERDGQVLFRRTNPISVQKGDHKPTANTP